MYTDLKMFINGQWVESKTSMIVYNPADRSELGALPCSSEQQLQDALLSAKNAFEHWKRSRITTRMELLQRTAKILEDRLLQNALITTLEEGKPLFESKVEWNRVIETLRWNSGAISNDLSDISYTADNDEHSLFSRMQPLGVCAAFTPWNFPALLPARKLAPAIASGCSLILKASEEAPGSAIVLLQALQEAGLPNGVVNLVFGDPEKISSTLLRDPIIRKCTFTGSIEVGKKLAALSAEGLKRCTFELGGHAPVIVFDDADIEQVIPLIVPFKHRNAGQTCIAPSRFYIHKRIHENFIDAFIAHSKKITIGDGRNAEVQMGPMINSQRISFMKSLCDDATSKGAKLVLPGGTMDIENHHGNAQGHFWSPTVYMDVPLNTSLMNIEPFGPISSINAFDNYEDMITCVNRLPYGLASYVFTSSEKIIERTVEDIECGGVNVNSVSVMRPDVPFGGIKESGIGYEGGIEGISAYMHKKLITRVSTTSY